MAVLRSLPRWAPRSLALLAPLALLAACPEEDEATAEEGAAPKVEVPDRVWSGDAAVLLRVRGGASPTSTAVHRALSRIFMDRISAADGLMRGGFDAGGLDAPVEDRLAGTAGQQASVVFEREVVGNQAPLAFGEAVDACGNPQLAAFLTSDVLGAVMPEEGPALPSINSADACADSGGCDTTEQGIWDVSLTETRVDGMVDVILQAYPAVKRETPGFLGHLTAVFLTDRRPGTWMVPLFAAAERVQIVLSALLEEDRIYVDGRFGDVREVYRYPHQERLLETKDVSLSLIGDGLCDYHHAERFEGETPYGCKLEDGRDLPLMLDLGSDLARQIWTRLMGGGTNPAMLDDVQAVMSYQVATWMACPSFEEPAWVRDGPVEIMVCPDGALDDCLGFHDMHEASCAYTDETYFTPLEREAPPSSGGGGGGEVVPTPTVSAANDTYRLTSAGLGGDMVAEVPGAAGDEVWLFTSEPSRFTLRGPGGAEITPDVEPNNHGCGPDPRVYTLPGGTHTLTISGTSDATFLLTRPDLHVP